MFVLLASALKLLGMETSTLGFTLAALVAIAFPLFGAVDAAVRRHAVWNEAGRSRTRWVALQGIGAPFGVGFVAAVAYFANVRKQLIHHEREMELVAAGSLEPATV